MQTKGAFAKIMFFNGLAVGALMCLSFDACFPVVASLLETEG